MALRAPPLRPPNNNKDNKQVNNKSSGCWVSLGLALFKCLLSSDLRQHPRNECVLAAAERAIKRTTNWGQCCKPWPFIQPCSEHKQVWLPSNPWMKDTEPTPSFPNTIQLMVSVPYYQLGSQSRDSYKEEVCQSLSLLPFTCFWYVPSRLTTTYCNSDIYLKDF